MVIIDSKLKCVFREVFREKEEVNSFFFLKFMVMLMRYLVWNILAGINL